MMEDRELDVWRAQWSSVAESLPDMRGVIHKKINRQNRWFLISNLAALVAAIVGLAFAVFQARTGSSLEKGEAVGIIVLIFLCAGYRLWAQRGTWRPETQSTHAFVELWHRRVLAKLRLTGVAMFVAPVWILFCGALVAVNWSSIAPDVKAHPAACLGVLAVALLTVPATWLGLAWYRRRKVVERTEVEKILAEMLEEMPEEKV